MPLKTIKQIEKYLNSSRLFLYYLWYAFLGPKLKVIRSMDLTLVWLLKKQWYIDKTYTWDSE